MSDSEHSTVSYTSISLDSDPSAWGIPLMDADEASCLDVRSRACVPEYLVPSHDDIPVEDPKEEPEEDLKEDPIDYAADADGDEDEEEESSKDDDDEEEEHLAPADSIAIASPAVDPVPFAEETNSFKTDESAATQPPPPTYHTTSRMSIRSQTRILFPSGAEVARLLALPTPPPSPLTPLSSPLPQISSPPLPLPSPPTSPTYAQAPLGCRVARIRAASPPTRHPLPLPAPSTSRRADILEADIPPRKRLLLTAPIPRFNVGESSATARQRGSNVACKVDYGFVDTVDASIRAFERWIMAATEVVNLRVSYQANVRRREREEFYTRHQDAQRDRAALRNEVDTWMRYISSLCTTHEQERVEAHQALDMSKAHNRALEARIAVLETQVYCHEWQRQNADDHATRAIMRI
ncbi:hypothetical protein Tco_0782068 [Tanacetum coccineum]